MAVSVLCWGIRNRTSGGAVFEFPDGVLNPILSLHIFDMAVGMITTVVIKAMVYLKGKKCKEIPAGRGIRFCRWGNQKDIAPFIDPVFEIISF